MRGFKFGVAVICVFFILLPVYAQDEADLAIPQLADDAPIRLAYHVIDYRANDPATENYDHIELEQQIALLVDDHAQSIFADYRFSMRDTYAVWSHDCRTLTTPAQPANAETWAIYKIDADIEYRWLTCILP